MPEGNMVQVLLIEDNPTDARLAREALKDAKLTIDLHTVDTGEEGLAFLRRQEGYGAAPRPDLILLDLNLPGLSGQEVLADIKKDQALRAIPVAVLTSSSQDQDVLSSYDLQASCYIVKPIDFDGFITVVQQIEQFWFTVVKLPPKNGPAT